MTKHLNHVCKNGKIVPKYKETELGTEKICIECEEYFPADTEFFWATGRNRKDGSVQIVAACKCCYDIRYKRRKYKVSAAMKPQTKQPVSLCL